MFLLAVIALLLLDWRQTLRIFAVGQRELNPVIRWAHARWGRRGVDGYFACWIAAVLLLDAFAPWAWMALGPVLAVQALVVVRNLWLGIKP